ncbi:MAG: Grx4 family monothiol glutaredoxin [Klebsiella pneumoniae]|nr:Grx4 family monothiol glutaredoxin [Klebsiella pneumoniae]
MSSTLEKIQRQIAENPILLYMKGSPKLPSCGFSAQAVQALSACGERFAYVDILQNPDIRAELPKYANWPTFPQLWVDGELVGGCDIVIEMYQRGELQQLIKETAAGQPPRRFQRFTISQNSCAVCSVSYRAE